MNNKPAKAMLNHQEAADYIGVSPNTLRTLRNKGEIPFKPIGKRGIRYYIESLQMWMRGETPASD